MTKKVFLIIFTIGISIGFVGCSNPPQPYKHKIQKKHSNITDYEKEKLLNMVVERVSIFKYRTYNGCILFHNVWYENPVYDERMKNCYRVRNGYIYRNDFSKCKRDFKSYKCNYISSNLEKYVNFLNKLQNENILVDGLDNEIKNYQKFRRFYNKAKIARINKYNKIKISLIDSTKILPKQIIDRLRNNVGVTILDTPKPMDLYIRRFSAKKYRNFEDFDKAYKNETFLSSDIFLASNINIDKIGRYEVEYDKMGYIDSYNKFPTDIIYKINKVYFNYIPKKFVISDKNIKLEVGNKHLIEHFKIYNKTKEFIEIDMITGYNNKSVVKILSSKQIKIPPMSYSLIPAEEEFPVSNKILVSKKDQKIKYGFSVGYKIINQNVIKSLYKVNNYSIQDYE